MLTFFVIIPILLAVLIFTFSAKTKAIKIIAIVFQSALFAASLYLVGITREADVVTFVGSDDLLGIVLRANSLSAIFVLLTTFIFLAVSIYSYSYRDERDARTFWFLMFLLEASFIGLFLSGDLFNIFVLIEVSTLVTVILTMYDRKNRNIFHGKVFLLTNLVSIQFYLLGLGYIYRITGALDVERVGEVLATLDDRNLLLPYVLIMTSIAFKNTLIPFFSWTPKVRIYPKSPTVVAAVMSGLQAKTSLYLFIRFQEMFAPIAAYEIFLAIGIVTGIFGAVMAICQKDIKMILAYHTISQIGLITVGISLTNGLSHVGGLYHIVSHAMFKTTLFLSAGIISHSYGTSNVYEIRGVMKRMPVIGIATLAAVLGITGAPFFIGSVSKYFISYEVTPLIMAVTVALSFGTIISFIKFSSIFFGHSVLEGSTPKAELCKTIPIAIMGAICFVGGIFGTQLIYFLLRYNVEIQWWSYVQKSLIFLASAGVGYLLYNYVIKGNAALARFGEMNFSFRSICASMGVFMALLLLLMGR
ncbi:MAG: proton-conducting membrane transporter [Defluviitaleaceae bacterium]|nr:proton-conducting membrane transporter [Defluviitaleaceae bacterium]MCL2273769.1 proton-conducting membrane transporter [Defluviitaleaceae bacterium]